MPKGEEFPRDKGMRQLGSMSREKRTRWPSSVSGQKGTKWQDSMCRDEGGEKPQEADKCFLENRIREAQSGAGVTGK